MTGSDDATNDAEIHDAILRLERHLASLRRELEAFRARAIGKPRPPRRRSSRRRRPTPPQLGS